MNITVKENPLNGYMYRTFSHPTNGNVSLSPTICCATSVLKGVNDGTSADFLKEILEFHKKDENNCGAFGQRNILVFAHAAETMLQKTLENVGFVRLSGDLNRRICYSQTKLLMYIYIH